MNKRERRQRTNTDESRDALEHNASDSRCFCLFAAVGWHCWRHLRFFMMVLQSCILVGARKLAIWICSYQVSRWRQKKREAHAACEQRTYFFFFIIYLFFSLREGWLFFFIVMINGCGGFTPCLVKKMVIICVDY